MEDKIKRLIFATSKIKQGHEAAAPKKAAYFVPTLQRTKCGNRVDESKDLQRHHPV